MHPAVPKGHNEKKTPGRRPRGLGLLGRPIVPRSEFLHPSHNVGLQNGIDSSSMNPFRLDIHTSVSDAKCFVKQLSKENSPFGKAAPHVPQGHFALDTEIAARSLTSWRMSCSSPMK